MSLPEGTVSFTESSVTVDGSAVRYLQAGAGETVVVLHGAHGLHINRTHELLAERVRVVALEIPGFGRSSQDEPAASFGGLALSVLRVIDALGIERFSLVGISFGAALAAWVATESPDRVDRLVLIGSPAIRTEPAAVPEARTPDEVKALFFAHPDEHELPYDPAVERNDSMLALLRSPDNGELEERLSELQAPTLSVFGAEDVVTPLELGRRYVELMPEAFYAIVYDAGHAVDIERPEATAEIVGDFLDRGSEFAVEQASSLQLP